MARGRTPAEAWTGTPDKVDFVPLYISYETYIFYEKRRGV
jgi:hypothetical protein